MNYATFHEFIFVAFPDRWEGSKRAILQIKLYIECTDTFTNFDNFTQGVIFFMEKKRYIIPYFHEAVVWNENNEVGELWIKNPFCDDISKYGITFSGYTPW